MIKFPRLPKAGNVFEAKYTPKQMHEYAARYAAMKAKEESEACAQIVEAMGMQGYGTLAIAVTIRARGQE